MMHELKKNNVRNEFAMSYNLIIEELQVIVWQLDQKLCFR